MSYGNYPGWIKHIVEEGSRKHVISYLYGPNGPTIVCSEPCCEINKPVQTIVTDESAAYGNDCPNGRCEV